MFTAANVINARRSGGTQRFHTHARRMIKTQDVAQHAYNVTLLALMLTRGTASQRLLLACLTHDSGEHWVGDVPAPTKRAMEWRGTLSELEDTQIASEMGLSPIELDVQDAFILKLSDSLEGLLYCLDEYEMGNRQMIGVARNFADYCDEVMRGAPPFFSPEVFDPELYYSLRGCTDLMFNAEAEGTHV